MIFDIEQVPLAFILGEKWDMRASEQSDNHKALHGLFALCKAAYPTKKGEEEASITNAKVLRLLQGMDASNILNTLVGLGYITKDDKGKVTILKTPWC